MKYRLVRFSYIDGIETKEELGVYCFEELNDIIWKLKNENGKRLSGLMAENACKDECQVRYEIYLEERTELVNKLSNLIIGKRRIEIHRPSEDIVIDKLSGLIRFYNSPNEFTISWDDLSDYDIDFLVDYIPELNT